MAEYQNIRTGWHCAFILHAHVVFVTKHRHKVFKGTHLTRMEEIRHAVCKDFKCEPVESNGENNHVHLLVNFPPKVALPKLVNSLKGASSRNLRQEIPDLVRHYRRAQRLCSGPASPDQLAARRCRSSVSTSSSRTVHSSLQVRATLRIASPPP